MSHIKKRSPAFMFYASDAIASRNYRLMKLNERGLYISMLCECWVNRSVPASPSDLAKLLSYNFNEISECLTERVLSFFIEEAGELKSPELDRYWAELEERRNKQKVGGKQGAKIRWDKESKKNGLPTVAPNTLPSKVPDTSLVGVPNGGGMAPRVEMSGVELSKKESSETLVNVDSWLDDYERASGG